MSLPFLLSCRPSSTSSSSKIRGGGAAGSKAYGQTRSSLDAGTAAIGAKRSLECVSEAELADVSWRQLLGYDAAPGHRFETVRSKRVCVVGTGKMGSSLAECLMSKPGMAQVGVYMGIGEQDSKFEIMPGVTNIKAAQDACAWADLIFFCCSYDESREFLRSPGLSKSIGGKCVVQMSSGTPEDAQCTAQAVSSLGAMYLDAFVLSEGTPQVFNHRLSSMMVSGEKYAWKEAEEIVRAVAPASFYGGYKVEWANAAGVGVLTFIMSVRMGLRQATEIGTKFGLPGNVLPQILSGGYLPVVQELVQSHVVRGEAAVTSLPSQPDRSCMASSGRGSSTAPGSTQPDVGSAEWRSQLERIRDVCRNAAIDCSVIDGFLASGCPDLRRVQAEPALQRMTASGASEHEPAMDVDVADFDSALNAFCAEGNGDMETDDMTGLLTAAWAP